MSLTDLFKLAKLTITGYSDPERSRPLGRPLEVQYNPETLSIRHESVFGQQPGVGGTSGGGEWTYNPPQRLNVSIVFDGTGVGVMGVQLREVPTVAAQIDHFLAISYYVNGETHEPAYLKLQWGTGVLDAQGFGCRLESVDINYKAFDRDGSPLHAELAAVFVKTLTPRQEQQQVKRTSPDLTHRRVVVAGDTLPLLCEEIYGSASHYLRVAQVNALDDFRRLVAGEELIFPPFDRPQRK
jgi:hypothetical protein